MSVEPARREGKHGVGGARVATARIGIHCLHGVLLIFWVPKELQNMLFVLNEHTGNDEYNNILLMKSTLCIVFGEVSP